MTVILISTYYLHHFKIKLQVFLQISGQDRTRFSVKYEYLIHLNILGFQLNLSMLKSHIKLCENWQLTGKKKENIS